MEKQLKIKIFIMENKIANIKKRYCLYKWA